MPKPLGHQILSKRNKESTIGEWEKINLLPIFAKYDKSQPMVKSKLGIADVPSFYSDLIHDKACIAQVPGVPLEDVEYFCLTNQLVYEISQPRSSE